MAARRSITKTQSGGCEFELRTGIQPRLPIPGRKNAIDSYQRQNFLYPVGGARDRKFMAGFTGHAMQRDECGDSGGVNALDRTEVERDGLTADHRFKARDQGFNFSSHQLRSLSFGFGINHYCRAQSNAIHKDSFTALPRNQ